MSYIEMGYFGAVEPAAVKALQTRMIAEGFLTGKADGITGPATFAAAVKWVEKSLKMVEKLLPIVLASGVTQVFTTLTARVKKIRDTNLPAAIKSGNPTNLAFIQKDLKAMFETAVNDTHGKLNESDRAFLGVNFSVLGTSSAVQVRTVPSIVVDPGTIGPAPAAETVSSSFPVLPVLGGLVAVGVLVAVMGSGGKKRKNPASPRQSRAEWEATRATRRAQREAASRARYARWREMTGGSYADFRKAASGRRWGPGT